MAAHDEQISTNRRRLFKALSVAPVVTALKPGAALANSSAYQCAAKARQVPPQNWYPQVPGNAVAVGNDIYTVDGFFFRRSYYWVKSELKTPSEFDSNIPVPTDDSICAAERAALPSIIVLADGVYVGFEDTGAVPEPSSQVLNVRPVQDAAAKAYDPDALEVFAQGHSDPCGFIFNRLEGLFSYVGFTNGAETAWNDSGFFPEQTITGVDAPGELQGITDSCMHSFMTARTSLLGG